MRAREIKITIRFSMLVHVCNHLNLVENTSLVQFSVGPPTFFSLVHEVFLRFLVAPCVSTGACLRDNEKSLCLAPRIGLVSVAHLNNE